MFWIMGAKLLGTALGLGLWVKTAAFPYLLAWALGIQPIWLEAMVSFLTKIEPGREKRRSFLLMDAWVDAVSFVLAPSIWFGVAIGGGPLIWASVGVFIFCGVFRLTRFVLKGLGHDGMFHGLPVTYTGYIWILCVALKSYGFTGLAALVVVLSAFAMVTERIRIRPSLD